MHRTMKRQDLQHGIAGVFTAGRKPRTGITGAGRATLIALAIACQGALANPEGPQVVNGSASFTRPNAATLNVTNSRNAIINWQRFNIDRGQTTNFIQPGSDSAVLNRVIGNNPSKIYGNLNSNGKVFLINQHGLMIGAGAQVNTAGFFGSTLNITNEDFLNGNLRFEGGGLGGIQNYGYIHAGPNGNVVLVAPDIENGGVIEVDNGNVILAAGESIRITSLNDAAIEFELQAPANGIVNLGEIIAGQGAARLFAGNLKHSGAINATGVVRNADGSISLVAQQDIEVAAGATLTADGDAGGAIRVQSHHGDVYFNGAASARGRSHHGGRIEILGERVGLFGDALVDASGAAGGGEVLIGGDFQGKGEVPNARQTQVGPHARIHADALDSGDGGKVIAWADGTTLFTGTATARGGAEAGDGGLIEVSGKENLGFDGALDTTAEHGAAGSVLFDPQDVVFATGGTPSLPANPLDFIFSGSLLTFDPTSLTELTNQGIAVEVRADRDIKIDSAIATVASGAGGDITLRAGQSILVNANILSDGGTVRLSANDIGAAAGNRGAGEAKLAIAVDTLIDAGLGNIEIVMAGGTGGTAGDMVLGSLSGEHIILVHNGTDPGGDILQNTGGTITAKSLFINHDFNIGGTVGTAVAPLSIQVDNFGAHVHGATVAPNGIHVKAQPRGGTAVTIGGTCYGAGDAANGCAAFGSHLITGLETVNGGGDIFLDVTGDLVVGDLVQISDLDSTGNQGSLQLKASVNLSVNADVRNNIGNVELSAAGGIDIFSGVFAPAAGSDIFLDAGTQINLNSVLDAGPGSIVAPNESLVVGLASVDSNMSLANLRIAGSTAALDNAGALQIGNVFDFDGGTLSGIGSTTLLAGATLTLSGTINTMTLDGHTLVLDLGATAFYNATSVGFGMINGATLVNNGNFDLGSVLGIVGSADSNIFSGGTFTVSGVSADIAVPFNTGGTLKLQAGSNLTLSGGLAFDSSTASLDNAGALQIGNVFDFDGGTLLGPGTTTLLSGATLNLGGAFAPMTLDAHTLVLDAGATALYNATANGLAMNNGALLINNGSFNLAQLDITAAGAVSTIQNGGQFSVGSPSATVAARFANGGVLVLPAGSSLTLSGGLAFTGSTASLSNAGALQIGNVFNFDGGTLSGPGITTLLAGATLNLNGSASQMAVDAQTLVLDAGASAVYNATANGLSIDNGATLINKGVFNLQSALGIATAGAGSTLQNGGLFTVDPLAVSIAVPFDNGGTVEVPGGTLVLPAGASLTLPGGLALGNGSLLSGSGTLIGNVSNNGGVVQPGGPSAIGKLTVNGNYSQASGQLQIEIQNTGIPGIDYDQLVVAGDASLLGNLSLLPIGGYTVTNNDSFTPLTYSTRLSGNVFGVISPVGAEIVTPTYGAASLDLVLGFGSLMSWDGGAGTSNWSDALNWSLDFVPDASFDVSISAATVNITNPQSVNSLSLDGNLNLALGADLTIAGALAVAGGTLAVDGGKLTVSGTANFDGEYVQQGGSATFAGNAIFNAAYGHAGGTTIFDGRADFNGANAHAGGNTAFNGTASLAGATSISGGTLAFNSVGTMHNLNNSWSGGTLSGVSGASLVLGVSAGDTRLSISGAGAKTLNTITLDLNQNQVVMSGNGGLNFVNATIDNSNGSRFEHAGDGAFVGSGVFDNSNGRFDKLAGRLVIPAGIDFINSAGSQVNVGGGSLAFAAAVTDPGDYNVARGGTLAFPNGRTLAAGSTLNLQGALLAGGTLVLPGTFNSSGNLVLNNAALDLANLGGTLILANGASLGGTGSVAGNLLNSSGVLVVGGAGRIGDLVINGNYGQGLDGAMVIDVFNNGFTTVSDRLQVTGAANLNGVLVIGFTSDSLGLVTASFRPFSFGGASGRFSRVIDAAGNILQLDFSGGEFTILGSAPEAPDSVIDDLLRFAEDGEELAEEVADNRSTAEEAIDAMLEEEQDSGELVCR